jgi:uncharacterized protein YueI
MLHIERNIYENVNRESKRESQMKSLLKMLLEFTFFSFYLRPCLETKFSHTIVLLYNML